MSPELFAAAMTEAVRKMTNSLDGARPEVAVGDGRAHRGRAAVLTTPRRRLASTIARLGGVHPGTSRRHVADPC